MENEVPFLIGMEAIKKLDHDIMQIGTETSKLKRNEAGHIIWSDLRNTHDEYDQKQISEIFWGQDENVITQADIKRMHENLAHAGPTKLMTIPKRTKKGQNKKEKTLQQIIKTVTDDCDACALSANPASKGKSTNMRAVTFNERIAIDLTEWWDVEQKEKIIMSYDR